MKLDEWVDLYELLSEALAHTHSQDCRDEAAFSAFCEARRMCNRHGTYAAGSWGAWNVEIGEVEEHDAD